MRKCDRCGSPNPNMTIMGDDDRIITATHDMWQYCDNCYVLAIEVINVFNRTKTVHMDTPLSMYLVNPR